APKISALRPAPMVGSVTGYSYRPRRLTDPCGRAGIRVTPLGRRRTPRAAVLRSDPVSGLGDAHGQRGKRDDNADDHPEEPGGAEDADLEVHAHHAGEQ